MIIIYLSFDHHGTFVVKLESDQMLTIFSKKQPIIEEYIIEDRFVRNTLNVLNE